jgi:integrator complex subunit 3
MNDLRNCQEEEPNMFCFLLPDIYSDFENLTVSNTELLNLVVSCIDSTQLQDLICHVLQGNMKMLRKENIVPIINASLEWETFEQYCLWQLITAHSINVENMLPVLPKLEFQTHSEALTNILLFLKRVDPTPELIKHIVGRDVKENDLFVVSVLKYWARTYETKLAELLNNQMNKSISPTKRKRHRTNNSQLGPNGEQLLAHLDQLRQNSKKLGHFFNCESIQTALTSAQSVCSESQKTRFSDLFALAEDYDPKPQPKRGKNAKGKAKAKPVEESNSDTDASEEDVVPVKPSKQTAASRKKRKAALGSDSD